MGKSTKKSKSPAWSEALDAHVAGTKGLTWAKIAAKMDTTEGAIRHWRNGTRRIKHAQLLELYRAAGVDPATILGGPMPGGSEDQLPPKEQILLHYFRGLFQLQQQRLITGLRALFDANNITRKELGQTPLVGVPDEDVEVAYGKIPLDQPKRSPKSKREPGTAMDDFLPED